jgi:hypothetical protein
MTPRQFRLLCQQHLTEANAEDAAERDRIEADPNLSDEPAMRLSADLLNLRMAFRRLGLVVLGGPDPTESE